MVRDDLVSMKNSITLYEKELEKADEYLKELNDPSKKISDPDISATIRTPALLRLLEIYEKLLNSYRGYVSEIEKQQ